MAANRSFGIEVPQQITPSLALSKLTTESSKQYRAFCDYYEMGADRSMPKLQRMYVALAQDGQTPPTTSIKTLSNWSAKNQWARRIDMSVNAVTPDRPAARQQKLNDLEDQVWRIHAKILGNIEAAIDAYQTHKDVKIYTEEIDGKECLVIERAVNTDDLLKLTRSFGELGKDLRKQLGLPDVVEVKDSPGSIRRKGAPTMIRMTEQNVTNINITQYKTEQEQADTLRTGPQTVGGVVAGRVIKPELPRGPETGDSE